MNALVYKLLIWFSNVKQLAQAGANLKCVPICGPRASITYDGRLWDLKLYSLEALKVGIGVPLAKPRTALGATHTAADNVAHDKNVIFATQRAKFSSAAHLACTLPNTVHHTCIDKNTKLSVM